MKIVLIIIILICFALLGYGLSKYYVLRKKFFCGMELLLSGLELDIAFSQEKLQKLIEKYSEQTTSNEIKILCKNYSNILKAKSHVDDSIFKDINILKFAEKELILAFLGNLGRFDATNQTKEIKAYSNKFSEYYAEAKSDSSKYSALIIKLSIIAGLLMCLLII